MTASERGATDDIPGEMATRSARGIVAPLSTALIAASLTAILTLLVAVMLQRLSRRIERQDAAAALRYEAESNLAWASHLSVEEPGPYLRDEAQVAMKNRGWLGLLSDDMRPSIVSAYEALYRLNELTRRVRHAEVNRPGAEEYADARGEFIAATQKMLDVL